MSRIAPVARREYLERIRSRAFWVGTVLGPVLMMAIILGPAFFAARQRGQDLRIAVVDAAGGLREPVARALAEPRSDPTAARFIVQAAGEGDVDAVRERLRGAILRGSLDGYLYLGPHSLESSAAEYYGKNVSNFADMRRLEKTVEEALIGVRLAKDGLDAGRVKALTRKLDLKTLRVSATGQRVDRGAGFLFSTLLMLMLYTTVLMWGQAVLSGVIEEKTNRVVEVVVSSIPASTLLAGKLAGVGAAGLTQLLVWALSLALLGLYAGSAPVLGGATLPEVTPLLLASFVVFFLLGYFLYAALYAAVGASVNTIQEAQNLLFPVLTPLIAAMVCFPIVLRNPDSTLSVTLSLIPFFTPILMFLRISVLAPPAWQIALSIVLTFAAVLGVTWVSARIYRVGILMYGKRPTFPEILRWVRHS